MSLLLRFNLFEWLVLFRQLPVPGQITAVLNGPFDNHSFGSFGRGAFKHFQRFDRDQLFVLAIDRMEMRLVVSVIVHPNQDAEELTNCWHYLRRPLGDDSNLVITAAFIHAPVFKVSYRAIKYVFQKLTITGFN